MDKKQAPFKINMTLPTSEMLGKHILSTLETTEAWVVPIYPDEPQPDHTPECIKHKAIFGSVGCTCKPDQSRLLKVLIEERTKNCVGANYGSVKENLEWLVTKTASIKDAEKAVEVGVAYTAGFNKGLEHSEARREALIEELKKNNAFYVKLGHYENNEWIPLKTREIDWESLR